MSTDQVSQSTVHSKERIIYKYIFEEIRPGDDMKKFFSA